MSATAYPSAGPDGQKCQECKYWQKKGSVSAGVCRRFPPPVSQDRNAGKLRDGFPQTSASDWCGEYSAEA